MAYTPEQYAAAGQFILANLNNPDLIASTASSLGLSANDLLTAAQTVNPNLTLQDVTGYFQQADTTYQPPVYTPEPVTSVVPVTAYDYGGVTSNAGALASVTQEPVIAAQRPIIETEAVTGVKPGGLASVTQKPVVSTPVVSGPSDNWMAGFAFDASKVPSNFDWQTYTNLYPDLVAAGIDTPTEAQRHYALYGATEGRQFAQETPNYDAVRQLYQNVLGRAADEGGLTYWAKQFGSGISPEEEAAFRQAAASEIAARPKQDALSNVATTASTTQGALSNVATAVDPRLSEVKSYWEQTTGDKTYAGLTDDQILKIVTDNPSNYKQIIEKAATDTNRNNAIKNQFLSIYDDPNKTGYEKAQEIKALAANAKVSDAEIASALGFTGADGTTLLNTFLNQPDPTTRAIRNAFADVYNDKTLSSYEKAQKISQLASTNKVSRDQLSTALNLDKKNLDAFLDQPDPTVLTYTKSIVGNYTDLTESKDLSPEVAYFLAQKLGTLGIDSLDDIRVEVIPGKAAVYKRGYKGAGVLVPEIPETIKVIDTKTGKEIDPVLFDDKAGTKYVLTAQGIQKQFDPTKRLSAQLAPYVDPSSSGGAWGTEAGGSSGPGFGPEGMMRQIAQRLQNATGVSDINQLGFRNAPVVKQVRYDDSGRPYYEEPTYDEYGNYAGVVSRMLTDDEKNKVKNGTIQLDAVAPEIYNKQTGQKILDGSYIDLGGWGEGPGVTYASLNFDANGKPKVSTYGSDSSDLKDILMAAAIISLPFTLGSSAALLGGGEAALLAAESGIAAGGLGVPGLTTTLAGAELGGLAALGEGAGAASLTAGALPTAGSLVSTLTSALPAELVQAGQTLYNTFNTVKPYLQAANTLYQASQGNVVGTLLSGLDAAGTAGVTGAKELGQALNAGLAISKGDYFPALQYAFGKTEIGPELANTKIAGDFTIGDALKGGSFLQALQSENPTVILNAAASLTGSQDLKVAAAASGLVNTLNNPNATAFDIAMGVSRVSDSLNTASQQPPPTGALPTGGQSTVTGALGTDTATGAAGNDVIDEYNVTGGGGALITSGNPTEDQQIAIQQRLNAVNQALTDYVGPGNDLSREGFVSQLQSLGFTKDQAEGYAQQADQKINMNLVGADVMNRYSKIDPEFGTPQLDRDTAVQEMVAAGFTSDRANEILNGIDAQNAIKLENKLSIQSAYNNFTSGKGTEEQLRSALTSAGYTDAEINNLVTRGNAILEGQRLTSGEQVQERVSQLPDVRAEISAKPTFSEAYRLARDTYGSGATFTWQGKSYSTDTFQENPALGLVPVAGSGRGQTAGKTAEQEAALLATAEELRKIDPAARAALLDPASINYSEMSPESNAQGLSQTAADKLVQSAIPVNAIKTAFGMTTEAAGNTLKAFGTIGESMGFNTAQMSDYGRRLENIAQELYPQALKSSEDEVKGRFASANSAADIGRAIKDSILNNPGAVAKMIGVEGLQEIPNILLAVSTSGASALIRYGGMLAGLGLDVVESAGLQGAQKVDEGLAKGLTRAQAVKGAVDDMKAAGTVTAVMTAAADKIPFGGTIAKTLIKGSTGEGIEEYVIARATGQDHMSALRQAAFGSLIGGPTEATLQGAGKLTNVTINGDTMIGTYEDGTKVSISEPAGATDLKIDIIKPTDTSVNVSNTLTADLSSGVDLTTSINNVVSNNITADLSGTIDSTVRAVIDNGADLSQGVTDLTSSAVTKTGDTTAVINNVVSSLASNGTDLNANAGSIVTGAVSGGASVTDAVDTTLKAVTANGGNVADAAASIITSVSASGDTAQVANATTAVVNAAIISDSNVTATTSNAVDAALAASRGSTDVVTQVVGGVASQGNNDATAAAVASAVTATGDTSTVVNAALTNGGDASTVLSTASNAAITAGTDTNTAVTNTLTSALNNNVDITTAVNSTVKGALDAGADTSTVVNSAVTTAITNGADTSQVVKSAIDAAVSSGADANTAGSAAVTAAITASTSSEADAASTLTAATAAAVSSGASTDVITDAVSNATGGSSSVTITSSGSTVTSSTVTGTVTTETTIDGNTGNSQTIISDGNTVTQTVTQGSVTTQTQVDTDTNTATVTETNAQTGQTTTTTIDLNTKVVIDVKETVTGGGGEDTLSGGVTQDTPLTTTLTPSPVSVEPLQVSASVSQAKPQTPQSRVSLPDTGAASSGLLLGTAMAASNPEDWLGGKLLGSKERDKFYDPLAELKALQSDQPQPPQSPLAEMAQTSAERSMPVKPYYSYGEEPSIDDILGLPGEDSSSYNEEEKDTVPVFKSGGRVSPLNIQMMYAKGGHTREDFRSGKHVAGPGDGQSDDIPAWLADGEFVFPADVVSALGNGSTKAGTEKLYDMMHEIRRRARSKHPKDLPPPALKSPLDYVKKGR
jgi:hypothetical protein